ncbi:MAG: hypothetical protein LBS70_01390 [Candidatus Accumulibacter sp.]|jgi:hypothetical protein|nr:hypothetical protein [Accumulibacter sp.]
MAKSFDDIMAALPAERRAKIERRAQKLIAFKNLRQKGAMKCGLDIRIRTNTIQP